MSYQIQLQWIRDLHTLLRSPWMDSFFKAWNLVDTIYFSTLIIALVWYLWDRRIGMRLFYIFVIGSIINTLLKHAFDQPRPCQIDPSVGILCFTSPGFPSGAAQTAALLCGVIFLECQRALYRWLGLVFALLLCFSRIYLGVHFISDIIGGLCIGSLLLLVYKKIFPLFAKKWKRMALSFSCLLLLLSLLLPAFSIWFWYLFFSTLGVTIGLIAYEKTTLHPSKNLQNRFWQTCIVILGLAILFAIELAIPSLKMLCAFAKGYWLSFLGGRLALAFK